MNAPGADPNCCDNDPRVKRARGIGWSSLPASGAPLTAAQQVLVTRMAENAGAAIERLQQRWQAEDNAESPP